MFTQAKAEVFVKDLLENVFPKGQRERLPEFYSIDMVGQFDGHELCFNDIVERVDAIKDTVEQANFKVKGVVVFDTFIAFNCLQNWINKSDKVFHESKVFGIYRIKNKKIVELWGFLDAETVPYREINKNFEAAMQPFKINEKTKTAFLQRLVEMPPTSTVHPEKLSAVEQECLYYYLYGASAKETAKFMDLSPRTVETYLAGIKEKFQCQTKQELRKLFSLD